ncbi:MAG: helix-turn-helix transcriptional regulator [Oscillospiraceae bacterium]|nr:helix-turn-helix transcriptional regulator [Oscillospiraceae bacterium]
MQETQTTKIFAERIQDLIFESGKSFKELERETGVPSGSLSKYQNDKGEAGINSLVKIARYFDVSTDYLLGLSGNIRTKDPELRAICEFTGLSEEAIAQLHEESLGDGNESIKTDDEESVLLLLIEELLHYGNYDYILEMCYGIKALLDFKEEVESLPKNVSYTDAQLRQLAIDLNALTGGIYGIDISSNIIENSFNKAIKAFEEIIAEMTDYEALKVKMEKKWTRNYMKQNGEKLDD